VRALRTPSVRIVVLLVIVVVALVALRPRFVRSDLRPTSLQADVLIVGGSAAGVAAAVAAARHGMIVVLVEPRPFLGTVLTGAMLNMIDASRRPDGTPLIKGIYHELDRQIGGMAFDPMQVREILRLMIEAEPGITVYLRTTLARPLLQGHQLLGAQVRLEDGHDVIVKATVTVDATDDGDLAAAAGVPFTLGRQTSGIDGRMMPATLMFRVADLDWPVVTRYAWSQRRGKQPSGATAGYVWGFRDAMRNYVPADSRLSAHDLNIGRLPDGTAWINSLQIHDVDGTDPADRRRAYEQAHRELPNLVAYIRANCPGFANARLVEAAPELYIRETRHVRGLYVLTAQDIARRTRFWDRVGAASYPVDLHQYKKGERYPFTVARREYTIPLRSLITTKVDGLFVASRAFSATYQAAGSARVVPTTMAMGEAAGVAAAVTVTRRLTPHQLAERPDLVAEVQLRLVRAGALIDY
jgi:hypothetical protein